MEVETPRSNKIGAQGGTGRGIVDGYRQRITNGVTFSDVSRSDMNSRKNVDSMSIDSRSKVDKIQLPRIVVRDVNGRKLDTFTVLQEAIYRAQWNVKNTCEAPTPLEWRLPKAPLPSRPDYSRQGPVGCKKHPDPRPHPHAVRSLPLAPTSVVEIGVEDVSYVAERLRQLPKLSSLPDQLGGLSGGHDRMYFHIVARLLLHEKMVSADDKREAFYEFPGFCTGCRRAGFCYSCSKGRGAFHVHHDQPVRTGGGYTYWKRDLPDHPDLSRHPAIWRLRIPEAELRLLLDADNTMSEAAKEALRKRVFAQYPWLRDMDLDSMSIDKLTEMGLVRTSVEEGDGEEDVADVGRYRGPGDVADAGRYRGSGDLYGEEPEYFPLSKMEQFLQARDAARKKYTIKLPTPAKTQKSSSEGSPDRQGVVEEGQTERTDRHRDRLEWESDSVYGSLVEDSEYDKENVDVDSEKKPSLYKAPKAFKLKRRSQRSIQSRSPFSSNRQYDIPKGRPMDIKKSDKSSTQFVDFKRGDSNWKEPKRFEVQHAEKKMTKLWQPKQGEERGRGRSGVQQIDENEAYRLAQQRKRRELERSVSPDSGMESELVSESLKESTIDTFPDSTILQVTGEILEIIPVIQPTMEEACEKALKIKSLCGSDVDSLWDDTETDQDILGGTQDSQYDSDKDGSGAGGSNGGLSPDGSVKKKRSAIIKKSRSPIPYRRQKTPPQATPEPEIEEPEVEESQSVPPSREGSVSPPPDEVYLPDINMPDLPLYMRQQRDEKRSQKQKFLVEAPHRMKTPPKKRKSPPKVRKLPKMQYRKKTKPAEAPVTAESLQDVSDPLDFLAKYCIINPNRLPFYEIIFENMVGDMTPRYERKEETNNTAEVTEREVTEVKVKGKVKKSAKKSDEELADHELKIARDMLLINYRQFPMDKVGLSVPEEYREKVTYTMDSLQQKQGAFNTQLSLLDVRRIAALAEATRLEYPDVCAHDYVPPDKKKGKKGKKSRKEKEVEVMTPRRRGEPIPDHVIVDRLTEAQLHALSEAPDIRQLNLERERTQEKMTDVNNRLQQLQGEKLLLDILCAETYYDEQTDNQQPSHFMRQQSQMYNKLHPDPDYELDLETVEDALQQINNHLLTDQEFKYLYFILNLPGRTRINFRLFSVIAALSEKVTQMDPAIRDLLNKFDYNALDVKMEKCKDLFSLLQDDTPSTPNGGAPASNLILELTAGGLKPEHIHFVLSKFNREGKGAFDFMDFVTYIPLFIEIHERIIKDPFCQERNL